MRIRVAVAALVAVLLVGTFAASAVADSIDIYVDAAPNKYGSAAYPAWEANAYAQAAAGTFVNMANGVNPAHVGSTDFEIQDEVVSSLGDLGKRLTWVYWVPNQTIASLTASGFEVRLENWWDGAYEDFYLSYYGSSWLTPSSWVEYNGGVIGTAGMAWWGAYNTNTQAELDADLAAWARASETWTFTARFGGTTQSLTSNRAAVPEPGTWALLALGLTTIVVVRRRRRATA